jgi:TIR domain protein
MNGISTVEVPKYRAKMLPEYDVFISHANADKEALIEEMYNSLNKLGVKIFYDKETLEWGDKFKDKILEGTKKSEFAIIVISTNFFGREWTERELSEFLNRQNQNGQKLILPILHNITIEQLKEKYPSIADIQAIDSSKYTCDQIALLFARQFIKRLKAY